MMQALSHAASRLKAGASWAGSAALETFNGLRNGVGGPSNHGANLWSKDLTTWRPGRRSADSDLLLEQGTLSARSRDLTRNSGIAKSGIQTTIDNVVGTGIRLVPKPNYIALKKPKEWADELARQIRATVWLPWADTTACDAADTLIFDQLTTQQLRAQLVDGDALCLPLWLPDQGDGWATKLQTVDGDRLSNPSGEPNSATLREGVAINQYGAPIGYWIRRAHPGDFWPGGNGVDQYTWDFVPKRTAFGRRRAIHCYDKERTGQSRGRPILSSVLSNFKGLDRYTAAEIQAAVVNAMIAMVIQTPLDQEGIEALFRQDPNFYLEQRRKHAAPEIESGSLMSLFPGDTMASFTPTRPASGFGMFTENVGRIIGLGLDLPYELLFKDFTKANYSSMRAAMLEAWRSFNRRRDDLGTQWGDPVYRLVLEEAVNAGRVDIAPADFYANTAAYCRCSWIGPGRGMVDPVKEAQASQIKQEAMISTSEDECAEQGRDWREVYEQLATEQAYRKQLGLPEVVVGKATIVPPDDDAGAVPLDTAPSGPTPAAPATATA